ncbi:hypothetical protein COI_2171 [Mannheimia haemolytica serotype A2 str. OVINE]|nr:hypothetical protein COI_2171 [Mannheimia haemolytica serotype A2 str. OVINE]TRB74823.1 hypothetical protein FEA63_13880 [Mannheimia haemolytica]
MQSDQHQQAKTRRQQPKQHQGGSIRAKRIFVKVLNEIIGINLCQVNSDLFTIFPEISPV